MVSGGRQQLWSVMVAATVAATLLSLATNQPTLGGSTPCANSSPQCGGTCALGETCIGISRGNSTICECRALGCCQLANGSCLDNVTALTCFDQLQFAANGSCGVECLPPTETPTATPTTTPPATPTATVTPTPTGIPNGGSCADPADCASGNCVADVCCDTPCNLEFQSCDQPGSIGTCTVIAPAPVASGHGYLLILLALSGIGGIAVWRRRRAPS